MVHSSSSLFLRSLTLPARLAFSPEGSILYVSSRDAGTVVAIDLTLNTVTRTYFLGGAPQLIF